jgi:hypothetical protein
MAANDVGIYMRIFRYNMSASERHTWRNKNSAKAIKRTHNHRTKL